LNGAKLVVVAHLRQLSADAVDQINQPLSRYKLPDTPIDGNASHETLIRRNAQLFDTP
jgi:hypothetical protein